MQKRVQVILDEDMIEALKQEAKTEGRSLSGQIRYKLMRYLELVKELEGYEANARSINEALNMGSGAYKP